VQEPGQLVAVRQKALVEVLDEGKTLVDRHRAQPGCGRRGRAQCRLPLLRGGQRRGAQHVRVRVHLLFRAFAKQAVQVRGVRTAGSQHGPGAHAVRPLVGVDPLAADVERKVADRGPRLCHVD
jgi:hypothetical protein